MITGISGFTGHYVAAELTHAGYKVYGMGSQESGNGFSCRAGDLLDESAVRLYVEEIRPDVVVHLAVIAFIDHGRV